MPDWRSEIFERVARLGLNPAREASILAELEQHLDQHYADLVAEGMPEESARKAVLAGLDDHELWREVRNFGPAESPAIYSQKSVTDVLHRLQLDLRFGLRLLRKSPGFAAVAILTLALGIGANTAIFTVVNAVLLEQLPFHDPGRLVLIREIIPKFSPKPIQIPAPDVLEYAAQNRSFDAVAGYRPALAELSGTYTPQPARVLRVTANLMPLLGVSPAIGRLFTEQEENSNQRMALLNYATWQRQFGSDPSVIGRTIYLDRVPYSVAGVMPRGFDFPLAATGTATWRADVWIPLSLTSQERTAWADNFDYNALARLKKGVSIQQANDDVRRIAQNIRMNYSASMREVEMSAVVLPLREQIVGGVRTLLLLLLGAVGCVLLIACANIANLLMARAAGRTREIAVRRALGATGLRIVAQLLTESLTLAVIGTALGLLLAVLGTKLLVQLIPAGIPLVRPITVNLPVLAFAAALAILTGVLFGLTPALSAARASLNECLKESARTAGSIQHRRFRAGAVVIEVAVAMVLLAGAGLLLRSFEFVRRTSPGIEPQGVMTAGIRLPSTHYHPGSDVINFFDELHDRLQHMPGVVSASASTDLPLETGWTRIFSVEGQIPDPGAALNLVSHSNLLGDYFVTMGIPLLRGRAFTPADSRTAAPVVIISDSVARRFFPNQDPIGKRLKWGAEASNNPWLTIVGVVADVKQGRLDQETRPHTYSPYSAINDGRPSSIEVRTAGDPEFIAAELRRTVAQLDSQLALSEVRTMEQVIENSTAPRKATLFLLLVFAGSALLLAAIGIYGVVAYSVVQRTREIGIRMTLGASPSQIMRMMFSSGLSLTFLGTGLGTVAALAASRLLREMLFQVRPDDPATFLAGAALLIGVAALATYLPARRATRVDPIVTLRYE